MGESNGGIGEDYNGDVGGDGGGEAALGGKDNSVEAPPRGAHSDDGALARPLLPPLLPPLLISLLLLPAVFPPHAF